MMTPVQPTRPRLPSRSFARAAGLLASLLLLAGCGPRGVEPGAVDAAGGGEKDAEDGGVALVLDGRQITISELQDHMKDQFLEEFLKQPPDRIYEMRETAARDLVQRHVVEDAAKERGTTPEALFDEITSAAAEPSIEDVTRWYSENQNRLRGARLEDVAEQIKKLLGEERKAEAWQAFLTPRLAALSWQMVLAPPRAELEATRLVRGKVDAPVTIMSFSDYQCPYCIRSEPVLAEVLERYPEKVRLVHRHFPLETIHPFARPASEAAMCADEQGRFWEFHDAIFARAGRLEEGSFAEIGGELGLDVEALGACIEERRFRDFVDADFEAGKVAGVTGTPAFFVNGIALKGARDADELSRAVDAELSRIETN